MNHITWHDPCFPRGMCVCMKVFIMDEYVYLNQCTRTQKNFSCNLSLCSILLFAKYININHLVLHFPTWSVFWGSNCLTLWINDCEWDRLKWHIHGYRDTWISLPNGVLAQRQKIVSWYPMGESEEWYSSLCYFFLEVHFFETHVQCNLGSII